MTDNFYDGDDMPVGSFNFYKDYEQAVSDITAERLRQINVEGWNAEHDDRHDIGELSQAAAAYALMRPGMSYLNDIAKNIWPWDFYWWKPANRRRNLVKSGALIVAEIERLDRAASKQPPQ